MNVPRAAPQPVIGLKCTGLVHLHTCSISERVYVLVPVFGGN